MVMTLGADGQPFASVTTNVYWVVTLGFTVGFGDVGSNVGSRGLAVHKYDA
jgi:hypothetical protein